MTTFILRQFSLLVFSTLFFFLFNPENIKAQVLHRVGNANGAVNYGNTVVTVTGGVLTGAPCYANPPVHNAYQVGLFSYAVNFNFSRPTNHVRISFTSTVEKGDSVFFTLNGQHFRIKESMISYPSALLAGCNCKPPNSLAVTKDGDVEDTMFHANNTGCVIIDIRYPNIQSFSINNTGIPGGGSTATSHEFWFFEDTTSFISQPYKDTVLCPGDSVYVPYTTSFNFRSGNTFTAQLSDAAGAWSTPVSIGAVSDINDGTVPCRIPTNAAAGSGYRIRLVSSDPKDTSLDNQVNIRIKQGPAAFDNTTAAFACTGDTLHLTGTSSTGGLTWGWAGPNSFTASREDTFIARVTINHAGRYILTASVGSTGCSLKDTVDVAVRTSPVTPTASLAGLAACETRPLSLMSFSSSTVSYNWTGPNGYTDNVQHPTVSTAATLAMSGDYVVTVTLNGCIRKDTVTVNVAAKPGKPVVSAANSPVCISQNLQLSASSNTVGASYFWYGPGTYTATVQNPIIHNAQLNDAGKYFAFVKNLGCASDTDSVAVTVNTNPTISIFPSPGANICAGQQAVFTAVVANGGASPAYKWHVNGSYTGVTASSYSTSALSNGDKVRCDMTSTGTCATQFTAISNDVLMTVLPIYAPTVTITADIYPPWNNNSLVTFTSKTLMANSMAGVPPLYQWRRNGVDVSGAMSNYWSVNTNSLNDNDVICLKVTSTYECPQPDTVISNCINTKFTGIGDVSLAGVKVYPNPVKNILRVEAPLQLSPRGRGQYSVELYDMMGRKVYSAVMKGNTHTIDMTSSPLERPGEVYLLHLINEDGERGYFKVVKE